VLKDNRFRNALAHRDFRVFWLGSVVSSTGDGMTFVALAWLVLSRPGGTGRLGLLVVCATLPVFVGGLAVGPVLDRFDKRKVLALDSVLRAVVMGSIPLTALAAGHVPTTLPFAAAACYGLLKMVPLAGFPAAIPDLVPPECLDPANALDSLGFGVSGMIGPALGGALIPACGASGVVAIDALSYAVFAVAALSVRTSLRPPPTTHPRSAATERSVIRVLLRDRVLVATTVAFMAFNIAEGMFAVVTPWLAKTRLAGGAATLGLLLAAMSAGELAGAAAAGSRPAPGSPVRTIARTQVLAGLGFFSFLAVPHTPVLLVGVLAVGVFAAPMTVWAQSVRMQRIPPGLRGRGFATLRTLMLATPPIGALLAGPLVAAGRPGAAAVGMAALASGPGLALVILFRREPEPPTPAVAAESIASGATAAG